MQELHDCFKRIETARTAASTAVPRDIAKKSDYCVEKDESTLSRGEEEVGAKSDEIKEV